MASPQTVGAPTRANGRSSRSGDWKLEPPATGASPKRRIPEVLVGLGVVAASALVAVLWSASAGGGDAVLALRNPLARGQVVQVGDLKVVEVATADEVALIPSTGSGQVVGRRALTGLPVGALVTPSQFAASAPVEAGEAVVGLSLAPGQYPSGRIAPGDRVAVMLTPGQGGAAGEEGILADSAEVYDVSPIGSQGEMFVSLLVGQAQASPVGSAAALDRVRLALVAGR